MQLECEIDKLKTLKKGINIIIFIESKQVKDVLKDIYNFMNKPIILTMHRNDRKLTFKCNIKDVYTLKKGMKIIIVVDESNISKVMKNIYLYVNHKIFVDFIVDTVEQQKRMAQITEEQRKKIYALFNDMAAYIGDTQDNIKMETKRQFVQSTKYNDFSLSDCSSELANDFIEFLIDLCFQLGVPLKDNPAQFISDTDKYFSMCLNKKICAICGRPAEIHHWNAIGMGRNREHYDDSGHKKIALCRTHHVEVETIGRDTFANKYHVYGIVWSGGETYGYTG